MKEYIGVYNQECVQLFVVRINADNEEDALEKFKIYIEKNSSAFEVMLVDDILVTELNDLDVI